MKRFLESFLARLWNRLVAPRAPIGARGLLLGFLVNDGQLTGSPVSIPHLKRTEHVVIVGRTGSGKTSLLKSMITQDVKAGRGFVVFVFHRELLLFCLSVLAEFERRSGQDLSARVIVIDPADPNYAVGLNLLEASDPQRRFVQIAELSDVLHQKWGLDRLGPRSVELLRNVCYALAANGDTLLEARLLLTSPGFLASRLPRIDNQEVVAYFRDRFSPASLAMRAAMSAPILDRLAFFAADPRFRHIVGQSRSSFSIREALDRDYINLVDLDKGAVGPEAGTFGAVFLTKIVNSVFSRSSRSLFSIYADEVQNLLASERSIETLFSESRKYGLSIVTINQFWDQLYGETRHAFESIGTHVLFQLSAPDADKMAAALGGGKTLAELLRNLAPRNFVLKSGHHGWRQGVVPEVVEPDADFADLQHRCQRRWAKPRAEVEAAIKARQSQFITGSSHEALKDWE